ncbi:MAG: hydroxyacid dehydrogenase [Burkholderiales bacterium]|nr:hydroxyacid dehydrogenase [Burkholderiales bacterium]
MTTPQPHILITQPVHPEVAERLAAAGTLDLHPGPEPLRPNDLQARLSQAHAMMGFMTDRVDAALLAQAPHLRIVACALKGHDSYDVAACTRAGVWLSIVPDLLTAPTAELAVGLAIGLGRHLRAGDALVRSGGFAGWRPVLYGVGLEGATVAVLGLGAVGCAIVERLRGFGCTLRGMDPGDAPTPAGVQRCTLEQALDGATHVFVAAPLTPHNRHLVNGAALARAPRGALWINVGRGSVVDEAAMADALASGQAGGYAADVFEFEDWSLADRPADLSPRLREHPATLFTPHLGSAVRSVRLTIEHRAADNILAVLAGETPPDAVNRPG